MFTILNRRTETIPHDADLGMAGAAVNKFSPDDSGIISDGDTGEEVSDYTVLPSKRRFTPIHSHLLSTLKEAESKIPNISDEKLVEQVKNGDSTASFWLLVRHYRYILRKIIDITYGRWYSDDVLQAGAVGLYEAAARYDTSKGVKFLTYAHFWILKFLYMEMRNELLPMGGLGVGRDVKEKLFNFIKYTMMGYSDEEIRNEMKISNKTLTELKILNVVAIRVKSLDRHTTDGEEDLEPYNQATIPSQVSAEDEFLSKEFIKYLEKQVKYLKDSGDTELAKFLELELGLNGAEQMSKEEICAKMDIVSRKYETLRRLGNKFLRIQMISDGWYDVKQMEVEELIAGAAKPVLHNAVDEEQIEKPVQEGYSVCEDTVS